jgi:ankyrin repeat protein
MITIPSSTPLATRLVAAIRSGDVGALERLRRDDPELATARIIDERGVARTLLHVAADWPGHFPNGAATVAALAAAGADVNAVVAQLAPHGSSETPLHWAASSDDVAVLDALLDAGADIEAPGAVFTNGTAMSDAVVFAQWRAARRLLERGAVTTLWQAAALGLVERVRTLCDGDPPQSEYALSNALWHACRGGQRATAELLLAQGATLNRVGHEQKSPLDVAEESGNAALVEWLSSRGAKKAAALR